LREAKFRHSPVAGERQSKRLRGEPVVEAKCVEETPLGHAVSNYVKRT
jgi:hypothetical protein